MRRIVEVTIHRALRSRTTISSLGTKILYPCQLNNIVSIRNKNGPFSLRAFMYSSYTFTRRVPDPNDPANLMKEDGVAICSQMWIENFRDPDNTVTNLTNYLRRFELWVLAYQKVSADETGAYMPRSSITRPALADLLALRNAVLDGRFKWGSRLEFFIRSPKDKTDYESLSKRKIRAILTTTQPAPFQNKIVHEVLLMVLEPIYEARFSQKSYAFRPGRNAHTVLRVVTCGIIALETSYQRVPRCVYVSSVLQEYMGCGGKTCKFQTSILFLGLQISREVRGRFLYISDFQSGLRALVKAGYGAKVAPFVKPSVVVDVTKDLSPNFLQWLSERNLSNDDRIMRLKEGYIKEGSTVSVMGVVQRHDNVLMIIPPSEPISTGCRWPCCLVPTYVEGLVLTCDESQNGDVIPV